MNKTSKRFAVAIGFVLIYSIIKIGAMDYEDARGAEQHYNEMVCAGYWPDYDNRQPDCGEVEN